LSKEFVQLDEKDELNKKLQEERKLTEEQIKMLNRIEASGDNNYATYHKDVYEPIIQPLISKYESRPADKQISYPHFIPKKFFVTVDDIMPNLKNKYSHGHNGTPFANEMPAQDLKDLTNFVENITNQTQEPDAAMKAYFDKISNNVYRKAVDNVYNNATQQDINNIARENAAIEATG
jgi:hypothetical protein